MTGGPAVHHPSPVKLKAIIVAARNNGDNRKLFLKVLTKFIYLYRGYYQFLLILLVCPLPIGTLCCIVAIFIACKATNFVDVNPGTLLTFSLSL